MVALIYPFSWQHTYIPVLPPAMIDIVCSPTPFLIGLLSSSLPLLRELPLEEVSPGRVGSLHPPSQGLLCDRSCPGSPLVHPFPPLNEMACIKQPFRSLTSTQPSAPSSCLPTLILGSV